jgi:hypothetical protein
MVRHTALRKVVGADLRRPVAGADLRATHARALGLLLRDAHVEQPRAEHFHRFQLVLKLRLLVLLAHHQAAGQVGDPHGGVGRVHALTARTRRAEDVDADVLVLDLDVDFLGLGKHGDRCRRGVNAALALGRRNALHAMNPRLAPQRAVRPFAGDLEYHFLGAAERAVGERHGLELPAVPLAEAHVHAVEVSREERGLVAAGAGADFDDRVALIEGIARQQRLRE